MPFAKSNGLQLCYDTFGDPSGRPLLMIMGLGAQMLLWREGLCQELARRGHYVIRFDNRDIGLSEYLDDLPTPPMQRTVLRSLFNRKVGAPYSLSDMARDAVGLLDALGLPKAHICGASMGGMIAQTMALEHPDRCASLTSVMSNTGEFRHRLGRPRATLALIRRVKPQRELVIEHFVRLMGAMKGPGFPAHADESRRISAELFDRAVHPAGFKRHLMAVFDAPPRTKALRRLKVPTLVIHGTHDPVMRPVGGKLTAKSVPGAQMVWIRGMGHRLPPEAWGTIADAIGRHTDHSNGAASAPAPSRQDGAAVMMARE